MVTSRGKQLRVDGCHHSLQQGHHPPRSCQALSYLLLQLPYIPYNIPPPHPLHLTNSFSIPLLPLLSIWLLQYFSRTTNKCHRNTTFDLINYVYICHYLITKNSAVTYRPVLSVCLPAPLSSFSVSPFLSYPPYPLPLNPAPKTQTHRWHKSRCKQGKHASITT